MDILQKHFGFHNVVSKKGFPEALAADIIDDDHASGAPTRFLLQLAASAESQHLITGIRWGLSESLSKAIDRAISTSSWDATIKLGWDPYHVQVNNLTINQVKNGLRPDYLSIMKTKEQ